MKVEGKNGIYANIITDSISESGQRITSMELRFHRFILPELNTHRMFSRNASSSRAIPTKTILKQIRDLPAVPVHWGANQAGMQAKEEINNLIRIDGRDCDNVYEDLTTLEFWKFAAWQSAINSECMSEAGYHKQITNRLTECFQFTKVILTATEWDNFFDLRLDSAAQPEIHELARVMKEAIDNSYPRTLEEGQWHLPYATVQEALDYYVRRGVPLYMIDTNECIKLALKLSVARCARVSYLNHDKSEPDIDKDIALAKMLHDMKHMSPFEHQATPITMRERQVRHQMDQFEKANIDSLQVQKGITHIDLDGQVWSANFKGFIQHRHTL